MKTKIIVVFSFIVILPLLIYVIQPLLGVHNLILKYATSLGLSLFSIIGFTLYFLKKKNERWYLLFLITVCSLVIELITSPLRGGFVISGKGFPLCAVITFIIYFVFIIIMLKKYTSKLKPQWILIACLLGSSILQLPTRIFFSDTLLSLPDWLFHLFGIFMGYFFYISGKYVKPSIVVISIICCSFLYFKGYGLFLHKLYFGTFTGIVHNKVEIPKFHFTDKDGNAMTSQSFTGKYVILDFWNTSCGVCFQEFPKFEDQYVKYKSNNDLSLYAVNIKLPRDNEGLSFEIISERGYSFPNLQGDQDAEKIFGIQAYPTVIVLNTEGKIVFRGNKDKAFSFLEREIKK